MFDWFIFLIFEGLLNYNVMDEFGESLPSESILVSNKNNNYNNSNKNILLSSSSLTSSSSLISMSNNNNKPFLKKGR